MLLLSNTKPHFAGGGVEGLSEKKKKGEELKDTDNGVVIVRGGGVGVGEGGGG